MTPRPSFVPLPATPAQQSHDGQAQGSWAWAASGMGIVLEGLLQHRRGRAGGHQGRAGWAVRGRDQARTAGVSRGAQRPHVVISDAMYLSVVKVVLYLLSGCTVPEVDESSLAPLLRYTIVLWTVGDRSSFWTRRVSPTRTRTRAVLLPRYGAASASQGHAAVAEAQISPSSRPSPPLSLPPRTRQPGVKG